MIGLRNLLPGTKALLCLLTFNTLQLQAANVNVPDEILASRLRELLNIAEGNPITSEALEGLINLSYDARKLTNDQRITDLEGLQHAVNLETLSIPYNRVTSLQPIADFSKLKTLDIYGNQNISDISEVSGFPDLSYLNIGRNKVSDVSAITQLTGLTQLYIHGNQITDSTPIHNLTNLTRLWLGTHDDPGLISDVSFVSNFTKLTRVAFAESNVSDISALANAPDLEYVDISRNSISDISALSQAIKMRWIFINHNDISDISPLAGMVDLEEIDYTTNPIGLHDALTNLSKLRRVTFTNTGATSIAHLANKVDLVYLNMQNNQIADLSPIQNSTQLVSIYFSNNDVTSLAPLQNHNALTTLVAESNEIVDISPLAQKPVLRDLRLRHNNITDASPLGSSKALWRVWLHNNEITTLGDWSQLSILDEVSISSNQLTDISTLGNCEALTELYAQTNQITTIGDFSKLTNLKILDVNNNQIEDLDSLATAVNMTHIQFNNNQVSRSDFLQNMTKLVYLNATSNKIQNLDFLQNLTLIKDIYLGSNEIRGDITLPSSVSNVTKFFLHSNFITSLSNLSALTAIGNSADDLHVQNNYLNTASGSPIVVYEQEADARVSGQEPDVIYTPQYSLNGDRDQDGIPDGWEIQNLTHPLVPDSQEDPDGDLYTNLEEFEGDTNPQDIESFSVFAPTAIYLSSNRVPENETNIVVGSLYAQDHDSAGGFQAIDGSFTWSNAASDAISKSGYLATITSELEQRFAVAAIPENKGSAQYSLGASDKAEEGNWQWITGEPFNYENWGNNDPNGGVEENYLGLWSLEEGGDRDWYDFVASTTQGYILEKNPVFELVSGQGDTDNHKFTISGNELTLTQALDFESSAGPSSVRVKVTDRHDQTFEQVLTIQAMDVNEPSTGINLSTTATPEDRPAASLIAIIFTTDPDRADKFTYELVEGQGSQDNSAFMIEGNQLKSAVVLDREIQATYNIRIRSTDAAQNQTEATFTIEALDMPENVAPNAITISTGSLKENLQPGTQVFTVWGVDPDAELFRGGIGTFSLVYQKAVTLPKAIALAERKSGHPAVIGSQAEWDIMIDQIGLENLVGKIALLGASDEETEGEWKWMTGEPFAFDNWGPGQPSNANEGEHHLEILGVNDNGDPVPELLWNDINSLTNVRYYYILEQPMTYELVAGRGDTDNHKFRLLGNRLLVAEPTDFENKQSLSIRVRVTDVGGLSYENSLTIPVQDAPDAPTQILLSKKEVVENLPIRSVVGTLSAIDQDANERHFFSLVSPSDQFYISGNQILTNKVLNFEGTKTYTLKVQVSDKDKLTYVQDIVINVTDANDLPTGLQLSDYLVEENAPAGTEVATLMASDPDINSTHTFLVVGGDDVKSFRTIGNKLTTAKPLDFEEKRYQDIVIRVTDNKKGFTDFPVTSNSSTPMMHPRTCSSAPPPSPKTWLPVLPFSNFPQLTRIPPSN